MPDIFNIIFGMALIAAGAILVTSPSNQKPRAERRDLDRGTILTLDVFPTPEVGQTIMGPNGLKIMRLPDSEQGARVYSTEGPK